MLLKNRVRAFGERTQEKEDEEKQEFPRMINWVVDSPGNRSHKVFDYFIVLGWFTDASNMFSSVRFVVKEFES